MYLKAMEELRTRQTEFREFQPPNAVSNFKDEVHSTDRGWSEQRAEGKRRRRLSNTAALRHSQSIFEIPTIRQAGLESTRSFEYTSVAGFCLPTDDPAATEWHRALLDYQWAMASSASGYPDASELGALPHEILFDMPTNVMEWSEMVVEHRLLGVDIAHAIFLSDLSDWQAMYTVPPDDAHSNSRSW